MTTSNRLLYRLICVIWVVLTPNAAAALDRATLAVQRGSEDLKETIEAASAVLALDDAARPDAQDIFAAALADYRNITIALYGQGHYSGVVRVRVNGREAAEISLLDIPAQINSVAIDVDPGPPFAFGRVAIGPLPSGSTPDAAPKRGAPAKSDAVQDAVDASLAAWRDAGHAKATIAQQRVVADHAARELSVDTSIAPGPRVVFGELVLQTESAVRAKQIRRIAGLPKGNVFSPETLATVANRLQRTGAFASVSLQEADVLAPGNSMDIGVTVVDAKPRRFGFGAEISTDEGFALSAFWLHRNALGGAERLRVDAAINGIGNSVGGFGTSEDGVDASLSARLDRPAVFGPDTNGFFYGEAERLDEPDFSSERITFGAGASRIYSDQVEAEVAVALNYSETTDDLGRRDFFFLSFPGEVTFDRRDDALNPRTGYFVEARATPFLGLDDTASGLSAYLDTRGYVSLDAASRVILAGRLQLGTILGADIEEVHPDFLFFSGGSSTVRGQPFQSLNVTLPGGAETGGLSFAALSSELRVTLRDRLSAVGFFDVGYVSDEAGWGGTGDSHSGAGFGVRYLTPIGPLRVDLGAPVSGDTGDGVQLYIGIGQAF